MREHITDKGFLCWCLPQVSYGRMGAERVCIVEHRYWYEREIGL